MESATVIGEKTTGITMASQEISKGLEQISSATAEIDKVTQQIAANSEESAAASEELSAQAEEMGAMVSQLTLMVYGKKHLRTGFDDDADVYQTEKNTAPAKKALQYFKQGDENNSTFKLKQLE